MFGMIRRLLRRIRPSRFAGLMVSPSPLVPDGHVVLKRNGLYVTEGRLEELRPNRKQRDQVDEIVVSPSDWHAIAGGAIR